MAYWLLKSEPNDYSYDDLIRDRQTIWDGVNNNLALKYMRTMKPGDLALIYHTGKERLAVGIAEVISDPYPDPALDEERRTVVDVKAVRLLPTPVSLKDIKAKNAEDNSFDGFDLLRIGRLSAVPVSEDHWQLILAMAGDTAD
ncbi:MAG: EVE domain-containing protein [Cyanophyceae cyanobacterium]